MEWMETVLVVVGLGGSNMALLPSSEDVVRALGALHLPRLYTSMYTVTHCSLEICVSILM